MADTQPELWNYDTLPDREDIVAMVQERSFLPEPAKIAATFSSKVTGKNVLRRLLRDEELCEEICTMLVLGGSLKFVAKSFGMSPRSVMRIKQAMADRGELAPVRLRIQRRLNEFVEIGIEAMIDGVLSGKIHPGQISIPVMAGIDKSEQLAAGLVPGTDRTQEQIRADDVEAAWRKLQSLKTAGSVIDVQPDSQSEVPSHNPLSHNDSATLDTSKDTNPAPLSLPKPGESAVDGGRSLAELMREVGAGGVDDFARGGLTLTGSAPEIPSLKTLSDGTETPRRDGE